jgi:nucleoside-diphosphate-sugar epimerase
MRVAVTGATGFLGHYLVNHLLAEGHSCRCWCRPESDRGGFADGPIEWVPGEMDDPKSAAALTQGVDAVVHAGLQHSGEPLDAARSNLIGTLSLIKAARAAKARRFVFISTCSVHEVILADRPLDESHPLWPGGHYGAYKAAVEKFVHSFGIGEGYDICALRPPGIYGLARPIENSKWYKLVHTVAAGQNVRSAAGGKEVHAADVAKAVSILLQADGIAGEVYNCCDRYVADQDVAEIARQLSGSHSKIEPLNRGPKNQIVSAKLRALGMSFGGQALLTETVRQMLVTPSPNLDPVL